MLRVCAQFGNSVKFVVELPELKDPEPVWLPNAFAIMKLRDACNSETTYLFNNNIGSDNNNNRPPAHA